MTLAQESPGLVDDASGSATSAKGASVRPPVLADGVQMIGEYEGSGYKEPPSLIRRPDGQVIQLPPLLYSVAAKADGGHTYDQIAEEVTAEIHRGLDAEQVQFLVEQKLRPLGVVAAADGTSPAAEKADPFLGLRFRAAVIPERTSNVMGALFKPLFVVPAVIVVLAAFVAADIWLFFAHGVAQAVRQALYHPGLFLPLFGAVVLTAAFHEIGHAAACRYGGGRPGKMGCGLYLAWPAFYTDVTDAYRLGKRARLRTDLGGVYFNVVVVLITVAAYFATGFEPLLLLVLIQHFEIAHQLLPVVRLDGYYIVADLTGVPDLFARIGPILRSLVPGRKADDRVTALKRWVRAAVTAWVVIVVPMLIVEMLIVLIHLPRIIGTASDSGTKLWQSGMHAFGAGNPVGGVTDVLQVVVLAIPIAGILLMLLTAGRRAAMWVWKSTKGRPVARILALAVAGVGIAALLYAWIPRRNYRPITPGERGTFAEGVSALRTLPSGAGGGPLYSRQVAIRRAQSSSSARSGHGGSSTHNAPGTNGSGSNGQGPTGPATGAGGGPAVTTPVPGVTVTVPPLPTTIPAVGSPGTTPGTSPPTTAGSGGSTGTTTAPTTPPASTP